MGRVARVPMPRALRPALWTGLSAALGARLDEADASPTQFATLDAWFTRRIRRDARPIEVGEATLVSPADGVLTEWSEGDGADEAGAERPFIKGRRAPLGRWLGESGALPWVDPAWAVVYLSPKDYHRVHSPVDGTIERVVYTPGVLQPVNPLLAGDGHAVFAENERVTMWIATARGPVAVVMVGATCVGGISLAFDDLRANRGRRRRRDERQYPGRGVPIRAGDELGTFHIGSTVLLVAEGGDLRWCAEPPARVVVGCALARAEEP
jgi:phosphatidylserine decarboxylase